MQSSRARRYYRRNSPSKSEGCFFKKESQESFFGGTEHEAFFHPAATASPSNSIQRKCEKCEDEDKKIHRATDKKEEDKKLMRAQDKKEEDKKLMRVEEKKEDDKKMMRAADKKEEEKLHPVPEKKEEEKLHRMDDKKEEDKKLLRANDKKEEEKIQKKETSGSSNAAANNTSSYISSLNGKGRSLPWQTQQFFSARMGHDFSPVKIHADKEAAESAKSVNAKAYTIGNNIVFNEGQYDPESGEGKKLMAHELAHVVQDRSSLSLINRKVNYSASVITETDPVSTVLNNPRLALTTPTINGNELPNDLKAATDILRIAFGKIDVTGEPGKRRCISHVEPKVDCGSNISIIKKPNAAVWQGSEEGKKFVDKAAACGQVATVTVYIKGKSGADANAVYAQVMTNEKEHVSDLNDAAKKHLEPIIALLSKLNQPVSGDAENEKKQCILAYVSLVDQSIGDFLTELDKQVKLRDKPGGSHDFKPDVIVDGKDCFSVVVKVGS